MGPPPSTERSADSAAATAMAAAASAASAAYVRPKKPLLARPLIRAAWPPSSEAFQNENSVSYRPPLVVRVVGILWSKHHKINREPLH